MSLNTPDVILAGLKNLALRERASEFADTLKISPYGNTLDGWQRQVLDSRKKNKILNCSRQVGKSTVTAIEALHRAVYRANQLILIVSPSLRQSQEIFKKVTYYANQVATMPDKVEDNQLSLALSNGSRIVALPGNPKTIRGYSAASLVIIDEAAFTEHAVFAAVSPMLSISKGDLMLLSTPNGKIGFFWEVWDKGGDDWEKFEIPWTECPRHTPAQMDALRQVIGEMRFNVEFLCQFYDPEDAVFSYDDLAASILGGVSMEVPIDEVDHVDNTLEVMSL